MKKSFVIWLITSVVIYVSCQREEISVYDKDANQTQLFFDFAYEWTSGNNLVDHKSISFAYDKVAKTDSIISVPVRILGNLADYDREFEYMIVDTSSTGKTGVNYDIAPSYLPADSIQGYMNIKIYNTSDLNDTTYVVCVRLIPNENFGTDYTAFAYKNWGEEMSPLEFYIYFDSNAEIPNLWRDATANMIQNQAFGPYSNVKFNFILQVLNVDRDFFMYDPEVETAAKALDRIAPGGAMDKYGIMYAWCAMVNNALDEYEKEHGYRLVDENGEEVKMAHEYR